jgi:hypothetical protein
MRLLPAATKLVLRAAYMVSQSPIKMSNVELICADVSRYTPLTDRAGLGRSVITATKTGRPGLTVFGG